MGRFDKAKNVEMVDPKQVFASVLKAFSGAEFGRETKYRIFYHIIGFKGITGGVGCSTIVANTAVALAELGLSVCVIDTSILHPCQDELLKTNYKTQEGDKLDWFDMPFTSHSVLNISRVNKNISVLSFAGKDRTILDMVGTLDSAELMDYAVDAVSDKFDIILIDLCDEPSNVNVTAMQKAQQVIQVWSDSVPCMASITQSISNNVILSCPLDKMRYVVENKTIDDTMGNLDSLYKEYGFRRLSHCGLSYEIARVASLGHILWGYGTFEATVVDFNNCILDIVLYICDIDKEGLTTGELRPRRSVSDAIKRNEETDATINGMIGRLVPGGKKRKEEAVVQEPQGFQIDEDEGSTDFTFGGTDQPQFEEKKGFFSRGGKK